MRAYLLHLAFHCLGPLWPISGGLSIANYQAENICKMLILKFSVKLHFHYKYELQM